MADKDFLMDNLKGFVPVEQASGILKDVVRGSSVIRLSKVEPMHSETKKFSVMTEGAGAYWVGESERIKTSKASWIFPEIKAKKLGVIIPVTREKLEDSTINVFNELRPTIAEAFAQKFDQAALFGTNSPFANSIIGLCDTSGNKLTRTDSKLDIDISDLMALIEAGGKDPNGFAAHYGIKNELRKLRDGNGNQLFVSGVNQNELYNLPIEFVRNGAWDKKKAELIAADWNYSIVGMRKEISYEISTEGTLQGVTMDDGKPLSLFENDMAAIKATMRIGYLPIKEDAFAYLAPKGEV